MSNATYRIYYRRKTENYWRIWNDYISKNDAYYAYHTAIEADRAYCYHRLVKITESVECSTESEPQSTGNRILTL